MWKLYIFLSIFCSIIYCDDGPIVESNVGSIRGLKATDGNYSMYMGIPYATINENNPFGEAIPQPRFEGIFNAYDDSAICPQEEEFNYTIVGTLDCMHINIYVPDTASGANKLPVLVWIYGGGFRIGFSGRFLYGPKYLVQHDIILVTFNYRLGPYGFMCLDIPEVPGNAGLKDQKMALEWIKDNIDAFGGDSDKITIYGMSASAVAVDMHYMYGDHGLFDKVILHSGTAVVPWTIRESDVNAPLILADDLGVSTNNITEALTFLATVEPLVLIEAVERLGMRFGLCVEQEFDGVERFIHDLPINVDGRDGSNKSALIVYNRDENMFNFVLTPAENFPSLTTFRNDISMYFDFDTEQLNEMEEVIRQFYIGDSDMTKEIERRLVEYSSDFTYTYPTYAAIKRYVEDGCSNVYHFVFSYDGERNFVKDRLNSLHIEGVAHADEVGYLFDVSYMDTPTPEDQLTIDRITTLWANFVKYGNPTPAPTELLPVTWLPATEDTVPYLELDTEVKVGGRHVHERVTFWELFYELNGESQLGFRPNDR